MDKDLNILVERLNRIFPHLTLYYEGEAFTSKSFQKSGKKSDIEKMYGETDFAPPRVYDWYDLIKILKQNGLEIRNIKD